MSEAIIKLENVTKAFANVIASENINLQINKGEIFAIVGENGAGKSTLMKMLYGLYRPTSGNIYIKGEKINKFCPQTSIEKGIGMVHQHFMLVSKFTASQNIVLGKEFRKNKIFVDEKKANDVVSELSKAYSLDVDPTQIVENMSVGAQQRVEILKALYRGCDILILDEPTAVLTVSETYELFDILRTMVKEKNMTIIIITHKLAEVMKISDRVAVIKKGRLVSVNNTIDVTQMQLSQMMVGREVLLDTLDRKSISENETIVSVKNLVAKGEAVYVNDVSFDIKKGEILGIAGIEGNGQSEIISCMAGIKKSESGSIEINKKICTNFSARQIRNLGVSHIPEDRLAMGMSKDAPIYENIWIDI